MKRFSLFSTLALACLFAAVGLLPAQAGTTGKIVGQVTDAATGEPLPGVNVVIDGTTQGTSTSADGFYQILNVKPGVYRLRASFIGYATQYVDEVQVQVDQTTTIDIALREEAFEGEEIVVTAERPIVQVDRTTTTAFVDAGQLEVLPVTTVGEVINLQAGVVDGHFRGGRTGEVSYLVNGVPINNSYSNSAAFEIEQNMVSGIEVISGVFNAEYGQAMSGVVNIVTKDVPLEWSGNALAYVGGIASTQELEFVNRTTGPGNGLSADDFEQEFVPFHEAADFPNRRDVQLSIGGPLVKEKLGIQLSGRFLDDNGHLLGRRLFMPQDSSQNLNSGFGQDSWIIESTGDGEFVPLGTRERYSINGTAVYNVTPRFKIDYNYFFQDVSGRGYAHSRKYVPDGINRYFDRSHTHILGTRYTINNTTFANLSYSLLRDKGDNYLYEVPDNFDETGLLDPRYQSSQLNGLNGQLAFQVGGNDLFTSDRLTQTHTVVGDVTSQVNRVHQVKAGFQGRFHRLDNVSYGIERSFRTQWQARVSPDKFNGDSLEANPLELSAYVQDKMEFTNLIVNAGVRFDYFDSDFDIPIDWQQGGREFIPNLPDKEYYDPSAGDSLLNRQAADPKWQVSPRIGLAFPISATGVMRFSAGLFFQIPIFSLLYSNPEFEVNPQAQSTQFGNPNIDPERTLTFEVGLQQQLAEAVGLELTIFSKDIRNLLGQEIERDPNGNFVLRWVNVDYGTVRGITFSLFQRPTGPVSWTLDYTLQFAEGSASDPDEAFGRQQSGQEGISRLQRLNWDRRHVLNNTFTVAPNPNFSLTFINRLQSGTPYTTVRDFVTSFEKNNDDKPTYFTSDMRLYYKPAFIGPQVQLFVQVDNIFDTRTQNAVYSDTGLATESVQRELFRRTNTQVGGVNSLDEWYYQQGWFGAPRRASVGLNYRF